MEISIPVIFREDNSHDPFLPTNRPVSSSPGTTGSTLLQCKREAVFNGCLRVSVRLDRRRECRLAACVDFFFLFYVTWVLCEQALKDKKTIYRRKNLQSCWGRLSAPRSCPHQRRGCWGRTSSLGRSTVLGCLGRRPLPALCSGWWRGLRASEPKAKGQRGLTGISF